MAICGAVSAELWDSTAGLSAAYGAIEKKLVATMTRKTLKLVSGPLLATES